MYYVRSLSCGNKESEKGVFVNRWLHIHSRVSKGSNIVLAWKKTHRKKLNEMKWNTCKLRTTVYYIKHWKEYQIGQAVH